MSVVRAGRPVVRCPAVSPKFLLVNSDFNDILFDNLYSRPKPTSGASLL